jgi:hypothetical protein
MQSTDGRFTEIAETAGIATMHRSRGAVLRDLNGDGRLDLAVVNRRAPLEIFENTTTETGNWLAVGLSAQGPNTQAIGAFVEVDDGTRLHTREVTVGGGHAGGSAGDLHFGVGLADTLKIRVIWPGGKATNWQSVAPNQRITITP